MEDATDRFDEGIGKLLESGGQRRQAVRTSEAIKMALVLPMLHALGYDPFDPFEVVPGYAPEDGGKVDYGVIVDETPRMLVTLSSTPDDLATERAQLLSQAAMSSKAPIGLLTSGTTIRAYAADQYGTFGTTPVLSLDLADPGVDPSPLRLLSRDAFDVEELVAGAARRADEAEVAEVLAAELAQPSRALLDAIATRLGREPDGLAQMVASAAARMRAAPHVPAPEAAPSTPQPAAPASLLSEDEEAAFAAVREAASHEVDPTRIVARQTRSYVAVLLDDNRHRTIARIHFKAERTKYLGTFVGRDEKRHAIASPDDVGQHADAIRARVVEIVAALAAGTETDATPDA